MLARAIRWKSRRWVISTLFVNATLAFTSPWSSICHRRASHVLSVPREPERACLCIILLSATRWKPRPLSCWKTRSRPITNLIYFPTSVAKSWFDLALPRCFLSQEMMSKRYSCWTEALHAINYPFAKGLDFSRLKRSSTTANGRSEVDQRSCRTSCPRTRS